jgi:cytochrome P450
VVGRSAESFVDARFQAVAQMQDGGEFARQDMLAKFMKSKNPKTGKVYTQHEVLTTAISVIGAGSDTTSIALGAFFGFLVRNPVVYQKLVEEIDNAFDDGTLTSPVKYSQGVQLPLFQACVKETLRLHPPASMSLPRFVPPEGAVIDGMTFPAGTEVSCSPYVVHRTSEAYGADAEVWRPERWLDLSDEDRRAMERCNLSFGAGSRQCIVSNLTATYLF